MKAPLKIKLFAALLVISLSLIQGYVTHASYIVYETLAQKHNYADLMLSDYLEYRS